MQIRRLLLPLLALGGCLPFSGKEAASRSAITAPGEARPPGATSAKPPAAPASPEPAERGIRYTEARRAPRPDIPPGRRLSVRREEMLRAFEDPSPERLARAETALRSDTDPLAPLAAALLARHGGIRAERALAAAADQAARPSVREAALLALVEMRAPCARRHCRRLLESDPHPAVRNAAAKGLGIFRDRPSAGALRRVLRRSPAVRLSAAWALARLGDPEGLDVLGRAARSGDPHVAPGAIRALGRVGRIDAAAAVLPCLFSPHPAMRRAALETLDALPDGDRRRALATFSAKDARRLADRYALLRCAEGDGPLPDGCIPLTLRGDAAERRLALECIGKAGTIRSVPVAVAALGGDDEVRAEARRALGRLCERLDLPFPPGNDAPMDAWQAWWFRLHRVESCSPESAIIRFPDGSRHAVRPGTELHWNAPVLRLRPGPDGGADVLVSGRTVRIPPAATP